MAGGLLGALMMLAQPVSALAAAAPSPCPAYQDPAITLQAVFAPPHFDSERRIEDIQALAERPGGGYAAERTHEVPVGLTSANLRLVPSFDTALATLPSPHGLCARISRFNLRFGFEDTTVYLARELHAGTCGFEAVLEHESRHIAMDRYLLADTLPRLRVRLAEELGKIGTVHAASLEEAESLFARKINAFLVALGNEMALERTRLQGHVDTAEEYDRLGRVCNGALGRLAAAP